jgi:NADH-quinone oxidoreductase subunit N
MSVVTMNWLLLAPVLAPALGAVLVLLLDALLPRATAIHLPVALVALGLGLGGLPFGLRGGGNAYTLCLPGGRGGACLYHATAVVLGLQLAALASALLVLLMLGPGTTHLRRNQIGGPAVTVALLLTATAGAALVPATRDLPTWLVAIELATLPGVALVALSRTRGAEGGALSLLMTSLTSFTLLAVGAALWVTATHDALFATNSLAVAWADPARHRAALLALVVMVAGLGFKLSAVPFHLWTPQAFVHADEPVAAFLATTSKVAALSGVIVVVTPVAAVTARAGGGGSVLAVLATLGLVSMTVGNVLALRADDPLRVLAFSTVAQGGWLVVPLAMLSGRGTSAAVTYLLVYAAASLAVFAVTAAVHTGREGAGERSLAAYAGLARRQPLLGGALGLGLLTLAGLPPGIIGLLAKVVALRPLVDAGAWVVVAIAVVNVVLGAAVYLRWLLVLVRDPGPARAAGEEPPPVRLDPGLLVALVLAVALLVVTSAVPGLLIGLS